ncbi:MAG: hypothetical protein M1819_006583 [Sarea resinae]|nr:MAG: hypothetical protein M1819_006583 [Sarea resinae]
MHLNHGTEQLRQIAPDRANQIAKSINELSEDIVQAMLESEMSTRKTFIQSFGALSSQVERTKKENVATNSSNMTVIHYAGGHTEGNHSCAFPFSGASGHIYQQVPRTAPRYPPGLGFAPEDAQDVECEAGEYMASYTQPALSAAYRAALLSADQASEQNISIPEDSETVVPASISTFLARGDQVTECSKRGLSTAEYAARIGYTGPLSPLTDGHAKPRPPCWNTDRFQEIANPDAKAFKVTWAKVAAIPDEILSGRKHGRQVSIVGNTKTINLTDAPPRMFQVPRPVEPLAHQRRVVWLINCPSNMTLREVSEKIKEGPLMSIVFVDDHDEICPGRAACIIFQHSEHAMAFYQTDLRLKAERGSSTYGKRIQVELGSYFPADEDIKSMDSPSFARRRLTFVRAGLFTQLTRGRFEKDVKSCVGEQNVELIHLYNSGNATVVLSSVKVSKALLGRFVTFSRQDGPYEGLKVSFSKDPCETEMRLISVMP